MNQNVIMDIVVAALLVLFAVCGARRGLLKSVAGLVILLVSLVGAAIIANAASPVITRMVQPAVLEAVEENLKPVLEEFVNRAAQEAIDRAAQAANDTSVSRMQTAESVPADGIALTEGFTLPEGITLEQGLALMEGVTLPEGFALPENITLPEGVDISGLLNSAGATLEDLDLSGKLDELLAELKIDREMVEEILTAVREKMAEAGVSLLDAVTETLVETVVHAVVFLLTFIVLNILLRVVLAAMDLVLMLPGLRTLNALGGAVVALVEGGLLLFLMIWVARRCAVDVAAFAENTVLFRFFANNTPLSVISFL